MFYIFTLCFNNDKHMTVSLNLFTEKVRKTKPPILEFKRYAKITVILPILIIIYFIMHFRFLKNCLNKDKIHRTSENLTENLNMINTLGYELYCCSG